MCVLVHGREWVGAEVSPKCCSLTCEHGGHHSSEHEEQHAEEETASIVESLRCLIADAQVQQANQNAHS